MPLFEFVCTKCEQPFEELLRSPSQVEEVTCPACGSPQVKKKLSTFASRLNGGGTLSFSSGGGSSCSTGST